MAHMTNCPYEWLVFLANLQKRETDLSGTGKPVHVLCARTHFRLMPQDTVHSIFVGFTQLGFPLLIVERQPLIKCLHSVHECFFTHLVYHYYEIFRHLYIDQLCRPVILQADCR